MGLPRQPTELDKVIREVELDEIEISAARLIHISEQLAELANQAKALVKPVDWPDQGNDT